MASEKKKRPPRLNAVGGYKTQFNKQKDRLLKLGGPCGICGLPVDTNIKDKLDPMAPVIDHIIPLAKGGHPSDPANLQLAHRWCNRQKADKLVNFSRKILDDNKATGNDNLPQHYDWSSYVANGGL